MKRSNSNMSGVVNLSLANYSQSDSSRNADAILYFIIPQGLSETTCTSSLQSAKKLCDDFSLHSQWVEEVKVKKMKPKRSNIFILDPFSGPAYEFLENLGQNSKEIIIIGPQCIHYALKRQDMYSAIESRGFPFYTMGMRNICVTFTGFKPNDQKELTNLVQKMNGIVSKPFCTAITHVVAHHMLTPKCKEAFKNEVPVMSANWVQQVWKDSQQEYIDATDSRYIVHTCGIFHNVNICVSQVPSTLKSTIEKLIKAGGGIYTKDFRRNVTQVLVVPTASGEKYKFADQWGVPTVTPDWVHKSKEACHVLPFDDFKPPKRPIYNSTQIAEDIEPRISDFSNLTSMSAIGEVPDGSVNVVNASRLTNCTILTAQETDVRKSDLDSLRLIADDVLNDCKLYLCQCDSPRMTELRLILLERGIDCCTEFSDSVTHVVIINGSISEKEIRAVRLSKSRMHIVSFDWLVQCAIRGQHVDETSYESEVQEIIQSCEARNKESLRQELNESLGLMEMNQRSSNGAPASSTTGRNSGDKLQRNPSQSAFVQPECVQRAKSISAVKEDSDTFKDGDPSSTVAEEAFVFSGFKFAVKLESQQESNRISDLIKESSGEILQDKDWNTSDDFILVVPPVYQHTNFTPWQSFTKYWVTEVMEEKILEIPEKFYHVPLKANENLNNLMNGMVFAISAYPTHIKEYITKVAVHLGAKVQEVFSRKDTKGSLKSTHLICGVTDNDKYRAAQRWGTPAVSLDWILKCYEKQVLLNHTEFLLQEDISDNTVFMYMKTPNNGEKNQRPEGKSVTGAKYNQISNSVIPGTDKSKVDGFRRPHARTAGKLNFDGDNEVEVPKLQEPAINNPFIKNPAPPEKVDSPIIHGMTREGSRQLKRAIDWALMDSPVSNRKERRKSTPINVIMKEVQDKLAKRAEKRRKELNISPAPGWKYYVDKEENDKHTDTPEKPSSPGGGIPGVNLHQVFVDIENEEEQEASSTANIRKKTSSSARPTPVPQQPENKLDYMDDFVAGIHDDGEASEIQWEAGHGANNKQDKEKEKSKEITPEKQPEVPELPEILMKRESPVESDLLAVESNRNVTKKRGTGSSVYSHKSSSSSSSSYGKNTRSKRKQESEVIKTLCFATSGGQAAEKEKFQSVITQLGGTISSVEHYDANTNAVIASKVARSEKILGSIAAGKAVLHPSYLNACLEAGRLIEFKDYIWNENYCKTNTEATMARVAQYWYKRIQENPGDGPYSKFVVKVCEEKSAAKKNAYIRLIEAGGGRIANGSEDPNIIISDGRSGNKSEFPPNVPVKVPLFLNDIIINFDDKDIQLFD